MSLWQQKIHFIRIRCFVSQKLKFSSSVVITFLNLFLTLNVCVKKRRKHIIRFYCVDIWSKSVYMCATILCSSWAMDKLNDFETTTDVLYSASKVPFLLHIRSLGADISSSSIITKQHEKKTVSVSPHWAAVYSKSGKNYALCIQNVYFLRYIFYSPLPMSLFVSQQ